MLRLDYSEWIQPTVAQILIPKVAYKLNDELNQVDILLQDESFEEPIVKGFSTYYGRPSVPVHTFLRLMFLKNYLKLSYEDLILEVTHNLMYRFFCRIPLEQKVPDASALIKITTRYGKETVAEINRKIQQAITDLKHAKSHKQRRQEL